MPMTASDLPTLNASLNATAAVLLATGYYFIRTGRRERHRACMIAALVASALFLTSYVIYHIQVGSVPFKGVGAIRTVYFTIVITHVVLAIVIGRADHRRHERSSSASPAPWNNMLWLSRCCW